jgi:hypothetical protein
VIDVDFCQTICPLCDRALSPDGEGVALRGDGMHVHCECVLGPNWRGLIEEARGRSAG